VRFWLQSLQKLLILGKKLQWGFKNAEFNADFESIPKIAKYISGEKSYQGKCYEKINIFTLLLCAKVFSL
jgi:hypothetical protein